MPLRKRLLKDAKLYLILDTEVLGYDQLFDIAKRAMHSGVDIIQLRDKAGTAKDIIEFSKRIKKLFRNSILYIINDRVDIAIAVEASGVHIGQEDMPIPLSRKMLGNHAIIGASCQALQQAFKAQKQGADYIGFGSVFKTLTKPDREPMDLQLLAKVVKEVKIPVFAIGGINLDNFDKISSLGVERFAVCRAICEADNIEETTRTFKKLSQKLIRV